MENKKLIVGTRGSALALTQTKWVINELKKLDQSLDIEIKIIKTKGDKILDVALNKIGDKGVFVKEIEDQLLNGDIDFAIHSLKDMPSTLPEGLKLTYSPKRANYEDVLVIKGNYKSLDDLPKDAIIGTGSRRRAVQLLKRFPNFKIEGIRGNVHTRMEKIYTENMDGTILAAAGLERLDIKIDERFNIIPLGDLGFVPAPCQGILGVEIREKDDYLDTLFKKLSTDESELIKNSEREFLKNMGGDCHTPVGGLAKIINGKIEIIGFLGEAESLNIKENRVRGDIQNYKELALELANSLLKD